MARINVGVLRGGPSNEYEVSLLTGSAVLEHLPEEKYNTKDILISRDGTWHTRGMQTTPDRALRDIDVVFIALHGEYGEDGAVQRILDTHRIPYTGSRAFASAIAMDKGRTRAHIGSLEGVRMPGHVVLHYETVGHSLKQAAQQVFAQLGPSYIVKPLRGGSSVGIGIAHSVADLPEVLDEVFAATDAVIVEQFIQGREATCGVIEGFRDEPLYALPPVEILVPKGRGLFDYTAKYGGFVTEECPANFADEEKERIQRAAQRVHEALGLTHYSRSDFIVTPAGIYFLEVNTLPGLTPTSLLPRSLEAVGVPFPGLLDHLITLTMQKYGNTR